MAKAGLKTVQKTAQNAQKRSKNSVKAMQMAIGVDLIGAKLSMADSRTMDLEATAIGIKMTSKKSNRVIVIPYSNVKGFELFPEAQIEEPAPAPSKPVEKEEVETK